MSTDAPSTRDVVVKVLYSFDESATAFLARSQQPVRARVLQVPQTSQQIGCIDLKQAIALVQFASPEWFQKGADYSLYYKDIMEAGEPFVGFGLCSKVLKDKSQASLLVTGNVSTNFMSLLSSGGVADTLEIKLKFCQVASANAASANTNASAASAATRHKKLNSSPNELLRDQLKSSSSPAFDDFNQPLVKRKPSSSKRQPLNPGPGSGPIIASRTQSLPFFDENSLAHKIRQSDTTKSKQAQREKERDINSRFQTQDAPIKAKKTKSFIQSIVKIGDTTITNDYQRYKCINCSINNQPPYKYYKEGIFHFGNSGFLCSICNKFKIADDIKKLRERGELGSQGLLQGPYSKSTGTRKRRKQQPQPQQQLSSSPNPQSASSSSPSYKRLKAQSTSSKLINNFPLMQQSKSELSNISNSINNSSNSSHGNNNNNNNNDDDDQVSSATHHDLFDITNILNLEKDISDDFNPLGATKLNTTLIQFDDEEKENGKLLLDDPPEVHSIHDISPSIRRIINSFHEDIKKDEDQQQQPPSPSAGHSEDWNYDFFNQHHPHTEPDDQDEEINRILNVPRRTPLEVIDETPRDAGTVQTQDDSPKMINSNSTSSNLKSSIIPPNTNVNLTNDDTTVTGMPSSPFFMNSDNNDPNDLWGNNNVAKSSPVTEMSNVTK